MRKKLILAGVVPLLFACMASAQTAVVLGIAPNSGRAGQSMTVEIKGVAFPASITASQVNMGADIAVSMAQVLPSQTLDINGQTVTVNAIRVSLSISASAASGVRPVRVGTAGGLSTAVFIVAGTSGNGGSTNVSFQSRNLMVRADAPEGLAALDGTRDGLMDLVVAPDGDRNLSFFRQLSAGTFAPLRKIVGSVFGSAFVAAADVNRDGRPDLITGSRSATSVGVWIAMGNGWRRPVQVQIPAPAWSVNAGDFNGDGSQDIIVVVRDLNQVALIPGNGNGTFRAPILRPVGDTPKSVIVADFNNDGLSDAIVGNFVMTLSVLMGNRNTGLSTQRVRNAVVNMENLISADFNNDGNTDVAVVGDDSIVILRGKGNGSFFPPKRIRVARFTWDATAADFNGDEILDLAFVNYAADQVSVMIGKGNLQFHSPFSFATQDLPTRILAADFNHDGRPDLALTNYGSDSISVFLNQIQPVAKRKFQKIP